MNQNTTVVSKLIPINFHGDTIYTFENDGELYTPVKPIVKNMGIDWQSQATKLRNNKKRWGCGDITIPSESGVQTYVCIPIRKVAGFLNSINSNKVRKNLKKKVELYQEECDEVLHDYWTKGKAINPRYRAETSTPPKPQSLSKDQLTQLDNEMLDKMSCWNRNNCARGELAFHKSLENQFQVERIEDIPENKFDEILQFLQDKYHHPERLGARMNTEEHHPNIVDDFIQFFLYRVNDIMVEMPKIHNESARHNITIYLTMMTSALGAAFPEEMQWLRFGYRREEREGVNSIKSEAK